MITQHYIMLQRNLLYTGITRAKKYVVLVGTKKALAIAVKNNKPQLRCIHQLYNRLPCKRYVCRRYYQAESPIRQRGKI
jgi:ATP-dependent exoDNAse (exonuclease V) alpha subunit